MVKDIEDNKMFDEILANSGSQYFFHRLENGLVEVVFKSGIRKIEPGEEDSAGRIWNPKLTDPDGNPMLDRQGKIKTPWTKFEAEVAIKGVPHIYSFSGEKSSILRNFIMAMKQQEISNSELPGTRWNIERIGQWDWRIQYLGREEEEKSSPSIKIATNPEIDKIKGALSIKKDISPTGVPKNDFLIYLSTVTHKKPNEVSKLIPDLIKQGIIKEEGNLIHIL